uniref:Ring finger protein, putative n=1 Tax=Arundo donax TaxID=35708 RepID=A0A0A8ZMY6_ARUDO
MSYASVVPEPSPSILYPQCTMVGQCENFLPLSHARLNLGTTTWTRSCL